jgi:hypothetical protein
MPPLLVCYLTLGGCRLVGAQEARRPFGRVGSDPQPAIRRIAGRRRTDYGPRRLFPAVSLGPVTEQVAMNRGIPIRPLQHYLTSAAPYRHHTLA